MIPDWTFDQPLWLLGWVLIPLAGIAFAVLKKSRFNAYIFSNTSSLSRSVLGRLRTNTSLLSWLALGCICIALARPQTSEIIQQPSQNLGIDMMMALDISASMMSKDLKPNRLEALKEVATNFVTERGMDRMGLVIYAPSDHVVASTRYHCPSS